MIVNYMKKQKKEAERKHFSGPRLRNSIVNVQCLQIAKAKPRAV